MLWRIGTTGKSNAAEAEFWSHEHPRSPGYAKRYGIPEANVRNADFIEAAVVPRGTAFVTREAPGVGANTGGGIEVVVRSGSARIALVLVSRAAMMGTSRDLYEESELLAVELDKRGETEAATRIRDAITGGSTSSEILFGLRWEFDRLLDRGVGGDAELAAWIADIRSGVAEALA